MMSTPRTFPTTAGAVLVGGVVHARTAVRGDVGVRMSPLGVEGDDAGLLAIDERGRVFVLDATAEWCLGASVDEALQTLTRGRTPARVTQDGTW